MHVTFVHPATCDNADAYLIETNTHATVDATLLTQVHDNGGLFFVPAFSGLFAPYWRDDARGAFLFLLFFLGGSWMDADAGARQRCACKFPSAW